VEENRLPVSGESLVGVYWWETTTSERSCSGTLADHLGSVRCNRKHDSWVKCATSAELKLICQSCSRQERLGLLHDSGAQLDSWFDGGLLDQMDFRWVSSG
jgi:hypothetical protein